MQRPDFTSRRSYRPALLLQVAVLVWLGVAAMPCTAYAADAPTASQTAAVDCHGTHGDAHLGDAECCCDPLSITAGEAPKSQRADLVAAALPAPSLMALVVSGPTTERLHPPPDADFHPSIYLATHRLRI